MAEGIDARSGVPIGVANCSYLNTKMPRARLPNAQGMLWCTVPNMPNLLHARVAEAAETLTLDELFRTILGVAVLVGVATTVLLATRAPAPWLAAFALARGVTQLAAISFVLSGLIQSTW